MKREFVAEWLNPSKASRHTKSNFAPAYGMMPNSKLRSLGSVAIVDGRKTPVVQMDRRTCR